MKKLSILLLSCLAIGASEHDDKRGRFESEDFGQEGNLDDLGHLNYLDNLDNFDFSFFMEEGSADQDDNNNNAFSTQRDVLSSTGDHSDNQAGEAYMPETGLADITGESDRGHLRSSDGLDLSDYDSVLSSFNVPENEGLSNTILNSERDKTQHKQNRREGEKNVHKCNYGCYVCKKEFTESTDLKKHMEEAQGKHFECDQCNDRFVSKPSLKRHIENKHPNYKK